MKIQDIIFFAVLAVIIYFRKSNVLIYAGLVSLFLSIPLFAKHIFFTAQHLTYYAAGFFLAGVLFKLYENWN